LTVLVGVLCKEGIVVGADSAATSCVGPHKIIEQPTTKKIEIIDNRFIVAGTGPVGLQQRLVHTITNLAIDRKLNSDRVDGISAARQISKSMIEDMRSTYMPLGRFGALVAYPIGKLFHLCEFDQELFQPELKTPDLWYVSMGSGQPITDPFLAFIREIFWTDGKPPSLQDGIFATVWAIQHAITVNPGGINEPIRIATLTLDERDKPQTRSLDASEIQEHLSNVEGAKEHLKEYRNPAPSPPIPDPE
jgi:20S proteasome alpha/beta subunit